MNMKTLLMEPYYVPFMIVFIFLAYQGWNGPSSPVYIPFLAIGLIIYIPFAITLCGVNSLISKYFSIDHPLSSIIYCGDLTEPQLPLLILILAIEYTIIYLVVKAIIKSLRRAK